MSPAQAAKPVHYAVWPKRVPHHITVPATSLWHNLAVSALRYPQRSALRFFDTQISYADLLQKAEQLAHYLRGLGVKKGDRVAIGLQNCPQFVVANFALLRLDAVVVPVNPMNRAQELAHYITDPDTQVAIVAADLAPDWASASNSLPAGKGLRHLLVTHYADEMGPSAQADMPAQWVAWLTTRHAPPQLALAQLHTWPQAMQASNGETLPRVASEPLAPVTAQPQDLCLLPYTSGTTGLPKGCMHTHASVMHNAVAGALWANGSAENITLCAVPMFHITGMVTIMHASVYMGSAMVLMPRWDRGLAGRLISRHRVTHWTNIPTMVIDLLADPDMTQYDLSSLIYIGGGGAAMPQAVAQRLLSEFGLRYAEGYGLTETAAPSHANPPDAPKQQCLGVPYISCDARVIDPDTLQELPAGQAGEIIMRGPMVFQGYWKRPEATAAAFMELGGERYFRSGDLGRVDEEGYFFITDRLKRMINASGFKVWPAEVEALMFKHPAIAEACIIAAKDAYRGETVKAVVVLRKGQEATTEQDIIAWCRDNMAIYKAPTRVQFVQQLPKSGSGKVMWRALQEAES